jgi:Aldo/keto reductases, related to diketogulonate reductase
MKSEVFTLSNGMQIPKVGLGTFRSTPAEIAAAVESAIKIGYRSFDAAWIYNNEEGVAQGIKNSGLKRQDVMITDKLWNEFQGYDSTLRAFDQSLKLLHTDYIDLYLIHWPGKDKFVETWKAFERLYQEKRVRAIGVSNFLVHHMQTLLDNCSIPPVSNQIETHVYFMDYATIDFCKKHNIQIEAWAPLGYGSELLKEKILVEIGQKHHKTPAQVALKYLVQNGIRVIPKSVLPDRQAENFDLFDFELSGDEMKALQSLNRNARLHEDPDLFF